MQNLFCVIGYLILTPIPALVFVFTETGLIFTACEDAAAVRIVVAEVVLIFLPLCLTLFVIAFVLMPALVCALTFECAFADALLFPSLAIPLINFPFALP